MRKPKATKEQNMKAAYDHVMAEKTAGEQNRMSDILLGYKLGFRACEAKYKAAVKAQSA